MSSTRTVSNFALTISLALSLGAVAGGCSKDDATPTKEAVPAQPAAVTDPAQAKGDAVMDDCPGHKPGAVDEANNECGHDAVAAGEAGHFGSPFAKQSSEALASVASRVATKPEVVQVSGTVDSVCQKAGCWMVLKDGDVTARIFTKAAGFFLPKDIAGKKAVVEGKLESRTMSERFAKHLEQDKGGDPSKIQGQQRELVMDATGVKVVGAS